MPTNKTRDIFREIQGTEQKRAFTLARGEIDEENRVVGLAFASDEPVERGWCEPYLEVLDMSPGAMRLDRINDGAAFLKDHIRTAQIGAIVPGSVEVGSDQVARCQVKFSRRQEAEDEYQDVKDEIRTKVSVGYIVHKMILEEERDDGPNVYRVTDWEPFEVSLVSIPADFKKSGVGRGMESADEENNQAPVESAAQEVREMPKKPTENNEAQVVDVDQVREEARAEAQKAENLRVREIMAIGERANLREMAQKAIREGMDLDAFRARALESMNPVPATNPGRLDMPEKEARAYSIGRAVYAEVTGDWSAAGLELEAHRAIEENTGRQANGVFIPHDIQARTIANSGTGGNLIGTDHRAELFVDVLRNKSVLSAMGAEILEGLVADQGIPTMPAGASFDWIDNESEDGTESTPTMGGITLTAKTLTGAVGWTRKMSKQSNPAIDRLVERHLTAGVAEALDIAAVNGAGGVAPLGILNTTGIGSVVAGNEALTFGDIVDLETAVANNNADLGALGYLTNARVRGALKQTEKSSGTAQYIWDRNEMNGYRALASNAVPHDLGAGDNRSACIFGNFADLYVGLFGPLDIKADDISMVKRGGVVLWVYQDADIRVVRPESFAAVVDIA